MKSVKETLLAVRDWMCEEAINGEIRYHGEQSHLVRCGQSQISLNVSQEASYYAIMLQQGKKRVNGSIACAKNDTDAVKKLIGQLQLALPNMPDLPFLKPMAALSPWVNTPEGVHDDAIANIDSTCMTDFFKNADAHFCDRNVEISGAFSAGDHHYAITNTLDNTVITHSGSDFDIELVIQMGVDKKELRVASVGETLKDYQPQKLYQHLDKILSLKEETPRCDLPAEPIDVIFAADALGELFKYTQYLAFHGESVHFKMGMVQPENLEPGQRLFGNNISITDDPADPDILFARHYGRNGMRRQRFDLVEKGLFRNLYQSSKKDCDRFDLDVNNDMSVASVKILEGEGPSDFEKMVASCKRKTIYIPYLHYLNITNAAKGEFTATSRFGTFLIENGTITHHLYNVRLNDSFHRIFNNVDWLAQRLHHVNLGNTYGDRNPSSVTCPRYTKVRDVNITGSSGSSASKGK